nr:PREDICTED: uncharacterized protein LOC104152099 isoform X2 [Struthio camelus australis]
MSAKVSEMEKMPTSSKGYLVKTAKKLLSKIIEFNPEEEIKLLCKFGAYLDYKELSGKGRGKVEKQILNLGKEWETQGEGEKSNLCKTEEPGCLCGETPPAPDSDGKMNKRLKKNVIRKQKNQLNCIQRDSWKKQNVFLPWAFIVKKINKVVLGTAVVNDNQESFSEENIILMSCIFIILTSYNNLSRLPSSEQSFAAVKSDHNVLNHRGSSRFRTPCKQEVLDSTANCSRRGVIARFKKNRKLHKEVSVGCLLVANATEVNNHTGSTELLLSYSPAALDST